MANKRPLVLYGGDLAELSSADGLHVPGTRIVADFTNSYATTRAMFQTNVADGATNIGILPNGAGAAALWTAFSSSDPANASVVQMRVDAGAPPSASINTTKTGSGSVPAFNFNCDGVTQFAYDSYSAYFPTVADPSTPAANYGRFYFKDIAGRVMPKWMGSDGVDYPIMPHMGLNCVAWTAPAGGSTLRQTGPVSVTVGTISTGTFAATSRLTAARRFLNTSAATAGSLASLYNQQPEAIRGNAAGIGGFFCVMRLNLSQMQSGNRDFFGLVDTTSAPTNIDPTTSTALSRIGLAFAANTGNWKLVHSLAGSAPTVIDLGANFPLNTTDLLEMILWCAPNAASVGYRITNLSTGISTSGALTTNLPSPTAILSRTHWMTNNATAAAVIWGMAITYMETDY